METNLYQNSNNLNNQQSKSFRILKVLVAVMGVMIIIGLFIVFYTIASRIIVKSEKVTNMPWSVKTIIDERSKIESITADNGRLFIKLKSTNGVTDILVFDSNNGNKLGHLEFRSEQ